MQSDGWDMYVSVSEYHTGLMNETLVIGSLGCGLNIGCVAA